MSQPLSLMRKSGFLLSLALIASLGLRQELYATPITIVDQSNPGPYTGTNGSYTHYFGQSFTPTLSRLDVVAFDLGSLDGTNMVVDLLDQVAGIDGLGGPVIATTDPTLVHTPIGVSTSYETFFFQFSTSVPLDSGHTYVARLRNVGSHSFGVGWTSDSYSKGQFLLSGVSPSSFPRDRDMVFATGLVPEPNTIGLLVLGAPVLMRRKRKT